MTMEHNDALSTNASDRYLLGEMSEPERFDFEAHYFECVECADDVRAGDALARGIRAVCAEDEVRRPRPVAVPRAVTPRTSHWTVRQLLPLAASLTLASVVGYQ